MRIEQRRGNDVREIPDDFEILARGVEHLDHVAVRHQRKKRGEIQTFRQSIDRDGFCI